MKLLKEYLGELNNITGLPPLTDEQLNKKLLEYINNITPETTRIDIRHKESNKVIGFLYIGYPPNCHPDADFYIQEAYIIPEFRHQGYMRNEIQKFVKNNPGRYCLFIINNNAYAKLFWDKLFCSLGYKQCPLSDVGAGDEYCTQYGYERKTIYEVI